MLTIEITGVFPANQGAMLMFEAILEQLRAKMPDVRIAVPANWPADLRDRYGLWVTREKGSKTMLSAEFMPASMRVRHRFLKRKEIDVLFDASGFGYGDFWGPSKLRRRLTERLAGWQRPGRVSVLLPQAFGPFERAGMATAMRAALDMCDLVFARDSQSADYLRAISDDPVKIGQAPDFTNLLSPALPEVHSWAKDSALIIPNSKMSAAKGGGINYPDFLFQIVVALRMAGREPVILLHERRTDRTVADQLNRSLDRKLHIVEPDTPIETKAIIANAELVVSSRFHGLVSALSSGVPALATGWTHKYRALLADYGCVEHMVDLADRASWDAMIGQFLASATDPAFRSRLAHCAEAEKIKSRKMWDRVFSAIADRNG